MEKFVLCRPIGGLNDNLCQIEACWRYCERTGRTLVVDTMNSGGFGLPFGLFFKHVQGGKTVVFTPSNVFLGRLNLLAALPHCVSGRLDSYKADYGGQRNFIDSETKTQLTFDMELDHQEPVLVHHQIGGGKISANCVARLRLTDDFKRDVVDRLSTLGTDPYSAVVIRNSSDYQTDYQPVFAKIHRELMGKRLLVCSDDYQVLAHAKATLKGVEVLELPNFVQTNGIPIAHYALRVGANERYQLTLKAISDLIALAQADKLFLTKIKKNLYGVEYSGFTMLSAILSQNKGIVAHLMGLRG